jgi:HD-GYP domain-containing protein (c-di-GMP phosphodiesterase class II)
MIQAYHNQQIAESDRFTRELMGPRCSILRSLETAEADLLSAADLRDSLSPSATAEVLTLYRYVLHSGQPQLKRISEKYFAWAVPLLDESPAGVALELVGSDPDELAELVNRSSLCAWTRELSVRSSGTEISSQYEQLEAYAAQVSEDLEELTWLRNLANNLELSESGNSVERIAETVLPSLCQLMNANSLIFVRDVPVTGLNARLPIVWQTGRIRIPRRNCLAIIEALRGKQADRTVVKNFPQREFSDGGFGGVESCVLVPVATASGRLGWLLAVDKEMSLDGCSRTFGDPAYRTYMSEREFGTFEASLMSATAVVLAAHGRNCGLFHEKEILLRGVIRSMINAIDAKDSYTCGHSDRVAEFSRLIARELSLTDAQCEEVYMSGLLHDVGKIGVPDYVLKKPGRLTDAEFELIKQHPVIGYEILKHLENLSYVLPGVLHHHEAMDGSGYPNGLKGEQIPLYARILAVADSYDAMTSNRPYRRGMPTDKAEAILRGCSGNQWDPQCVDAFFRTVSGIRLIANQRSSPYMPSRPDVSHTESLELQQACVNG